VSAVEIIIGVHSTRGFELATWTNRCSNVQLPVRPGMNTFRMAFQHLRLLPGRYFLGIGLGYGRSFEDWLPEAILF
jgi:hypothetical protein